MHQDMAYTHQEDCLVMRSDDGRDVEEVKGMV